MAISKLKITFFYEFFPGSTLSFNLLQVSTQVLTPVTFTWVVSRSTPYEVTWPGEIPEPVIGGLSAAAFKEAFEIDFPTYTIEILAANQVLITSPDSDISFSGGTSTLTEGVDGRAVFVITRFGDIAITDINSNGYLINNEIWMGIVAPDPVEYFQVTFRNTNNGKVSRPFTLYPIEGQAGVDIAPVIKSMFDYPEVRNYNEFIIDVEASNGVTASISRGFLRGGNRTNDTNQNLSAGDILRPTIKLPYWTGYPTSEYYLDSGLRIRERVFDEINDIDKDFRRVKGCNNLYFKFLNQMGGYSNWLFESYSEPESNTNLGAFVRNRVLSDLGNEVDNVLNVYSKVPEQYIDLIKDLIVSPEIYIYRDGDWVRIYSGRNTIDRDPVKRAYAVKLKFNFEYRYNPSLLWSN